MQNLRFYDFYVYSFVIAILHSRTSDFDSNIDFNKLMHVCETQVH